MDTGRWSAMPRFWIADSIATSASLAAASPFRCLFSCPLLLQETSDCIGSSDALPMALTVGRARARGAPPRSDVRVGPCP
jgi:hypothetical protein